MQAEPREQALGQQAVSGLSWQMLASAIKFVSSFGIGIALARLLPPEDFGIVGLAYIATGFAATLTDLGFGPAIIQRKELTERHIRVCQTLSVAATVLMGVALFASAGLIADFFKDPRVEPVLQVLALSFPFTGLGITSGALLTRQLAFKTLVKIQLFASILGYGGVAVAMAATGFGYWSLVGGTLVQTVLSTVLQYVASRHTLRPLVSRAEVRDLFGFSAGMSLTSTVNYFARQGDYFVVGRLMDATSLGLYSRAYTLMQLPMTFFGQALSKVLFPAASRVQDDPERFRRAFLTTFSISVAVSLPVSLMIAILAPEIILVLYGEKWAATIPLLQILALFGMFRMSYNTAAAFVRARGQAYRLLLSQVIYGALVLGGSWWAGSVWGLAGVAWAVGGAIFAMWLLVTGFAMRATSVGITEFGRTLAWATIPGLAVAAALFTFAAGSRMLALPQFVVMGTGGLIFAALTLWSLSHQAKQFNHPSINALRARGYSALSAFRGLFRRSAVSSGSH